MNVVRWSPFREFDNLFQSLDRPAPSIRRADWLPLVDIRETSSNYQIDVEVPAVAAEDLSVSVTEGVLSVSGERKPTETSDQEGRLHRVERRHGKFVRNFQLPEDADVDAIEAQHRDGVLYLAIAKRAAAVPKKIDVKVS
ncbi:MAG: Hsp20/alpha crystallin family protein [Pseudomonadota bacterium]